jgi:hypothetical protein
MASQHQLRTVPKVSLDDRLMQPRMADALVTNLADVNGVELIKPDRDFWIFLVLPRDGALSRCSSEPPGGSIPFFNTCSALEPKIENGLRACLGLARFVATVMHGLAVQAASRAGRKDLLRVTDMSPDMASGLVSWGGLVRADKQPETHTHNEKGLSRNNRTSRAVSPMSRALSKRCRSILFSIGKSSL